MGGDFSANQGDLTQPYSVYGRENQRRAAENDPPFGRFGLFPTRPLNTIRQAFSLLLTILYKVYGGKCGGGPRRKDENFPGKRRNPAGGVGMLGIRQGKSTQNGGKRPALWAFRQCANNRVPQQIRNCIWRGIFAGQGGGRRWAGACQGRQRRYGEIRPGGKCNFPAWRNTGRRRGQAVKNRRYSNQAAKRKSRRHAADEKPEKSQWPGCGLAAGNLLRLPCIEQNFYFVQLWSYKNSTPPLSPGMAKSRLEAYASRRDNLSKKSRILRTPEGRNAKIVFRQ